MALRFVKKMVPGYCAVHHKPRQPDAGAGLCQGCEDIVAREGITVPQAVRTRGGQAAEIAAAPAPATPRGRKKQPGEKLALLDAEGALVPQIGDEAVLVIGGALEPQLIELHKLRHFSTLIDLSTQDGYQDGELILGAVHAKEKLLETFLQSYVKPLRIIEEQYRELIRPVIKLAESIKGDLRQRMGDALTRAKALQAEAFTAMQQAHQAGQPIPDSAALASQGITPTISGTKPVMRWRFAAGKGEKDLMAMRPDLFVVNRPAIDGLMNIVGADLGKHTHGVLETYEETTVISPKVS